MHPEASGSILMLQTQAQAFKNVVHMFTESGMVTSNIRILIVDDNLRVRHNLAAILELAGESAGLHPEIAGLAADGCEAVVMARELKPDVILMDLEMPNMNGYEATRQIKSRQPGTRVVVLSVHAEPEDIKQAREAGADGFVIKGANYQTLLNAILGMDGSPNSFNSEKGEKK